MPQTRNALISTHTRTALAVLATCFALNMLGRSMGDTYTVYLRPIEQEFGWSRSELTGVYSLFLLVGGFTSPLVGLLFDRAGPRVVYTTGVACLGTAFFLASSISQLWEFYLLVGALVGLGYGLNGMVPASALLARWFRARLSTALGIAFAAIGTGAITFIPLAQFLVSHWGWRVAYRVQGLFLLAVLPLVAFAVPWRRFVAGHPARRAEAKRAEEQEGWTLRAAIRTPIYWGLAQAFFFTAMGMFVVIAQTVVFFIDAGFSPIVAATAYGFTGMLSVVSVTSSGLLSDRFGVRQTVTASFVGTTTGMLLLMVLATHPATSLLVAYVLVFGLCQGMRGPIISSICTRHFAGRSVGTIYGTIFATNALGAAVGSVMGGVLHDLTGGYRVGFTFALCSIALAVRPFWAIPALRDFR